MTSPPVPPQAITAAWALWLHDHTNGLPCSERDHREWQAAFTGGWEAAAPHLTAARLDDAQAAAYATGVTDGAAAEREKLVALADQQKLTGLRSAAWWAALLREAP